MGKLRYRLRKALCQGPNNVQAGLFFQLQGNSRVQTSKLAQWLGQKLRNSRCVGQDMHQALLALRERLQARFDLLRAIEQCARAVQQFQARCSRADTFVRTQQQGGVQRLFQICNPAADRGGSNMLTLCRLADRAFFQDADKQFEG